MPDALSIPSSGVTTVLPGPILLGYLFNWALFGILSVQVYLYYMAFPNDRWSAKTLVSGLYILETLQTILMTHDAYVIFGSGYGNPAVLDKLLLAGLSVPILTGIVSCIVQASFAYRISILSGSRMIALIICLIALTQLSAAITAGIKTFLVPGLAQFHKAVFASSVVWLTSSVICDVVIAALMTYFLHRSNARFKSTQVLVSRLIRLTIETGTITAAVATLDLILFVAFPNDYYFDCTSFVVAKVYSNACVAMLNSRMRIVGGRDSSLTPTDISLTFPLDLDSRHDHDGRDDSRHIQDGGVVLKDLATDVSSSGLPMSKSDNDKLTTHTSITKNIYEDCYRNHLIGILHCGLHS